MPLYECRFQMADDRVDPIIQFEVANMDEAMKKCRRMSDRVARDSFIVGDESYATANCEGFVLNDITPVNEANA